MTSLFDLLLSDIKRYEISLLILRHVLLVPLPSNLSYSQQRNVIERTVSDKGWRASLDKIDS